MSPLRPQVPDSRSAVETPSGKHAGYENFPVGSWLLPARLRPHILTFYHFARAIDDIADSPTLSVMEKTERLGMFAEVLKNGTPVAGYEKAMAMSESLAATGVTSQHCLDLITAFRQDTCQNRYKNWDALMAYCMLSAAPVGRYLMDLNGGGTDGYHPSDALCCALQIINHVQDCGDDYDTLDRVYLPQDWMREHSAVVPMLGCKETSPELRRVLDRLLDATDQLLDTSRCLPSGLKSRRLGMEAAFIQRIAEALSRELRQDDPLANRMSIGPIRYGVCGLLGLFDCLFHSRQMP